MQGQGLRRQVIDLGDKTLEQSMFRCIDLCIGIVAPDDDCPTDHCCMTMQCQEFNLPIGMSFRTPEQVDTVISSLMCSQKAAWPDYASKATAEVPETGQEDVMLDAGPE